MKDKTRILSANKVFRILNRMAVEIYEHNLLEEELILVGIHDQGFRMAEYIHAELRKINPEFNCKLLLLHIDKASPSDSISTDWDVKHLNDKPVVVIDDVLNTSKTLAYCLKFLLAAELRKVEIAVLVNRSHAMFPIAPSYSGYELATTLDEHIEVVIDGETGAYLY